MNIAKVLIQQLVNKIIVNDRRIIIFKNGHSEPIVTGLLIGAKKV